MGTQQLLDAFQRSHGSFESYPRNLLHQTCHIGTLQAYITRLDNAAAKLFTKTTPDVVFRDFDPTRQGNALTAFRRNLYLFRKGFGTKMSLMIRN